MKKRKANRLKGFDYSKDNLYFVTNCVKNNLCCLGKIIAVGTGRDLSVRDLSLRDLSAQDMSVRDMSVRVELNQHGLIVEERIKWLMNQYDYVDIHNYVVMPNHFHLIVEIDSQKVKGLGIKIKSLSSIIGALKTTSSNQIHNAGFEDFAWHRSFYDSIIKSDKAYQNIFKYIDNNPQKWFEDEFFERIL